MKTQQILKTRGVLRFDSQPNSLLCVRHTYLWWSHSLAPGKSLSCSPNLATASLSRDEWFYQSTTWWGWDLKKTWNTQGEGWWGVEDVMWVEEKEWHDEARVSCCSWFHQMSWNFVFAFQMQCILMPTVQQLLTWTLESVWDDLRGRRKSEKSSCYKSRKVVCVAWLYTQAG